MATKFCPPKYVTKFFRDKGLNLNQIIQENYLKGGNAESLVESLNKTGLNKVTSQRLAENVDRVLERELLSKKEKAIEEILKPKIKDPNIRRVTVQQILAAKDPKALEETKFINAVSKKLSINDVDPGFRQRVKDLTDTAQKAPEGSREREIAKATILQELAMLNNPEFGDKVFGYFRGNLLSDPINALFQNPVGNIGNALNEFFAQAAYYTVNGKPQIFFNNIGKAFDAGKKGFWEGIEDVTKDIDTKSLGLQNVGSQRIRTFTNKGIEKPLYFLEKIIDYSLRPVDYAFANAARTMSLLTQMAEKGVTEATPEMIKRADFEGARAVFTQNTVASEIMTHLSKKLPFGLGKLLIPFAKVPANIAISKTLEFSPLKFIGSAFDLIALTKFNNANPLKIQGIPEKTLKDIGLDVSRASVGTVTLGLGYLMASTGLINPTNPTKEDRAVMQAMGIQPGSLQIGPHSIDVKKLAPGSINFVIGSAIHYAQQKKDANMLKSLVKATLNYITQESTIDGAQRGLQDIGLLPDSGYGEKDFGKSAATVGANIVGQAIPLVSLIGSVRQGVSGKEIETYDPDPVQAEKNKLAARLFAQGAAKVDVLGNEMERGAERFNPFKTTIKKDDPILNEISRLQKATGKKVINLTDKKYDGNAISAQDYQAMQRFQGEKRKTIYEGIFDSPEYQNLSDEVKEKIVSKAEASIEAAAKAKILGIYPKEKNRLVKAIMDDDSKGLNQGLQKYIRKQSNPKAGAKTAKRQQRAQKFYERR